jgi:small subunit ribosomal protein S2
MPYVNHRWLGGLLTNWRTISERIAYLHDLRRLKSEGQLELLPSKERITMMSDLEKLEANLGGVADMKRQPDAVFVIDLKKEQLGVREARRLGVPVVGLVDTNADPDEADFVIPGNDDAIRSCNLIARVVADGIAAGKSKVTAAELERRQPEAADATSDDHEAPVAAVEEPQPEGAPQTESEPQTELVAEPETEPEPAAAAVAEGGDSQ